MEFYESTSLLAFDASVHWCDCVWWCTYGYVCAVRDSISHTLKYHSWSGRAPVNDSVIACVHVHGYMWFIVWLCEFVNTNMCVLYETFTHVLPPTPSSSFYLSHFLSCSFLLSERTSNISRSPSLMIPFDLVFLFLFLSFFPHECNILARFHNNAIFWQDSFPWETWQLNQCQDCTYLTKNTPFPKKTGLLN